MTFPTRLALLCTLALVAACGTVEDLPTDGGSRKDGGFVLVEDPPAPDAGQQPGTDGGAGAADGGRPDGGSAGCGDSQLGAGEGCDDGNTTPGDGCSGACLVETGFTCDGEPSDCVAVCGDGKKLGDEACDDGNTDPDDGCAADCTLESGFACDGGACAPECGDGQLMAPEACDDGNTTSGDGCSATCTKEPGFTCTSAGCEPTCGDGIAVGVEGCDDGNQVDLDGCDSACDVEDGHACAGSPSQCTGICGDGQVVAGEACDDGATVPGDGCSATCKEEAGFTCTSEPSECTTACGDALVKGTETCDDGNIAPGDGCDEACAVEPGFTCTGSGATSCLPVCGDGLVVAQAETCDDGNTVAGDGCSKACKEEYGFTCSGAPSLCETDCGDGRVASTEACDPVADGGLQYPYGCADDCTLLGGMKVELSGAPADATAVLTDPSGVSTPVTNGELLRDLDAGTYTLGGTVVVRDGGVVDTVLDAAAAVKVTVTGGAQATGSFSWTERGGTGALWVGSPTSALLGIPDATLSGAASSCNGGALPGSGCGRTMTGGTGSHRAVVALADGTLGFGGGAAGSGRIVTYSPAELAKASPVATQVALAWPQAVAEISALAAAPDGTVYAASGDAVYALPKNLAAGTPATLGTSATAGNVLALAVTGDAADSTTWMLWVAARTSGGTGTTSVLGYTLGAGGTLQEVASLEVAVPDPTDPPPALGAQVALAATPDGSGLWMADGILGSPNQVRLQSFSVQSLSSQALEPDRTFYVGGLAAPTGLALGKLDEIENACPMVLADDSGKLVMLPAADVAALANEGTFSNPTTWTTATPAGLAFSPPRP